jgi:8-oxo-dGTP pyrophosphatase MutT (NUDIX family)
MDRSCATKPIETPKVSQLTLSFNKEADMVTSLRAVESAYWDYIDNYNKVTPRRYPYYKLVRFFEQILYQKYPSLVNKATDIMKMYTKYKKSLATDGIIMYTFDSGLKILLVRITGSKIWSMPKGKREPGEESWQCAIREFEEETGFNICDTATRGMDSVSILKTNFYLLEADYAIPTRRYKTNEISGVRWISVTDILHNKDEYSKQAILVAEYLRGGRCPPP